LYNELFTGVRLFMAISCVFGQGVVFGLPGGLDSEFRIDPSFNILRGETKITSFVVSDGLPTIQLGNGTVLRLDESGRPDPTFARSAGDPDWLRFGDSFPMHVLSEGRILALNPPRVIDADGETLRRITHEGYGQTAGRF
jgi:hypothetical protein